MQGMFFIVLVTFLFYDPFFILCTPFFQAVALGGEARRKATSLSPAPMWSWGTTTPWGGVDLLNQNTKNYCIAFRNKKWYWPLYTWFLDVQLVQAWRLFRKTMKERHTKLREREAEEDAAAADCQTNVRGFMMARTELQRIEREELRKALRKEEKKKEEMDLLEFKRQCVELLIHNHSDFDKGTSHREAARQSVARSSGATQESLRFDHTKAHLIEKTEIKGVCQHCKKRSNYRCKICRVALPPDCFSAYHKK